VVLGLLLGPSYSIGQQQAAEPRPLPTLTNAHDAHSLTLAQAARNYPVHLRAVVTYYDLYVDLRRPSFFVSDSSGAIFVVLSSLPAVPFEAGDLVEITGVSAAGDYAPIVSGARVQLIGKSVLPATAPRVTLTTLLSGAQDGQWVEVEGVVQAVWQTGKNINLELALSDGAITAATSSLKPATDNIGPLGSFSIPESFRILLRSTADVVVIKSPSWWTPAHALAMLGVGAVLTLVVLAWVIVLRRRVYPHTRRAWS
jgi:hypothetical protein